VKTITKIRTFINQYGVYFLVPPVCISIYVLVLYLLPIQFFPDLFNIKHYSKTYELFNLIISSLVSIIAIYISVSLVAYEFFRQKSGIDFQKSFFINNKSGYYVSFTVWTILFTFLCSIKVSVTNPDYKEVSIIYFNIILFVLSILFLIPIAFNLFSSFKPVKLASEELQKITGESIFIQTDENMDIEKELEQIENCDYLGKVANIVIALITVSDNIKAQAIIQKTTLKLSNLIIDEENPKDKEYIIDRLISFFIKIIDFSLLQPNNTAILGGIWIAIDIRMYSLLTSRKETAEHYEKFRKQFFERYFNRLFENNKEEIIFEGITTLRYIIQKQVLFNTAEDQKIYSLNNLRKSIEQDFKEPNDYTDEDYRNAEHWREIAIDTMGCFGVIISKAIKQNRPEIINKCFEQINKLNYKLHSERVGICKQSFFYINSAKFIFDYAYSAFEKNIFIEGQDAEYLTPTLFENLIEEKHPAARTVLQKYCYLLINLQQINKLDKWFLGGLSIGDFIITEGELGEIARRCSVKFDDGIEIQNCLADIIETFKILKEYYEKNPPINFNLYLVIRQRFSNILELLENKNINAEGVINNLKQQIASFKEKGNSLSTA